MRVPFEVYVPQLDRYIQKTFPGKQFEIDGRRFTLFRSGVLAAVLYRSTRTIVEWERKGSLPKPIFTVITKDTQTQDTQRWYSEKQINMMQAHLKTLFGPKLTTSKNFHASDKLAAFFELVKRDWYIDFL